MPAAALALNIAWEWLYTVLGFSGGLPGIQTWVNLVWGCADLVIMYTFLRYGRREFAGVSRAAFSGWAASLLMASVVVQVLFVVEFGQYHGAVYSAFLQNLLMSGLFVAMFVARGGSRGQSLTIAVGKWLGTLAPTIQFGVLTPWPFVLGVGLLCSLFDLAYLGLLVRDKHSASAAGPPV